MANSGSGPRATPASRTRRLLLWLGAGSKAVAEDGWKIVGLLRLSPLVPFNLQNYLFGATGIPFAHFVAATFFGIIPGTALYTYFGVLGAAAGKAGPVKWVFFAVG